MNTGLDTFDLAKMIHQERLRESVKSRLYRSLVQEIPSPAIRMRQRLGNLLLAIGNRLKVIPDTHARAMGEGA